MSSSSRVSLQDIARELGLSRTTVSLALRNHPRISENTKRKVKKTALRMGYKPDPKLAELMYYLQLPTKARAGETLAYVVVTDLENDLHNQLHRHERNYQGAKDRAEELGYRFQVFELKRPEMKDRNLDRILYSRGIRGIILSPLPHPRGKIDFQWERYSVVRIAYTIDEPKANRISGHHFYNAYLAIEELHKAGYRRIGMVLNPTLNERTNHLWRSAFADYIITVGDPDLQQGLHMGTNERALMEWYRRYLPDAIIGEETDNLLEVCKEHGLSCPKDFGYARLGRLESENQFAGIVNQRYRIGQIATDTVAAMVAQNEKGIPLTPKTIMIDGFWQNGPTIRQGAVKNRKRRSAKAHRQVDG